MTWRSKMGRAFAAISQIWMHLEYMYSKSVDNIKNT